LALDEELDEDLDVDAVAWPSAARAEGEVE
jgi:hypothetical protein